MVKDFKLGSLIALFGDISDFPLDFSLFFIPKILCFGIKNKLKGNGKILILVDCRTLVDPSKIYPTPKLCSQQFL